MWIKILISFFCPRRRNLIDQIPVPGLAPLPSGIPTVSHSRRRRLRNNFGARCHGELGAKAVHLAYQSRPFGCEEVQSGLGNNAVENLLPQESEPNTSNAVSHNNPSINEFAQQTSDSLLQCSATKSRRKQRRREENQEEQDMKKLRKLIKDDDCQEKNDIQMIIKTMRDDEKGTSELIKQGRMSKGDIEALAKLLEHDETKMIVEQDAISELEKFFLQRAKKLMNDNRQPGPVKRKCQKPVSKKIKKMSQKDARETKDAEALVHLLKSVPARGIVAEETQPIKETPMRIRKLLKSVRIPPEGKNTQRNAAAKKKKKPVAKSNIKVRMHQPYLN